MPISRRISLQQGATIVATACATALPSAAKAGPNDRVRFGIIGVGGRAQSLIRTVAENREAEIVAMADVDANRLPNSLESAFALQGSRPRAEADFRRLLDDPSIDAIVIATPDHWHAIPTILACQAGKDVYVEKPDAHNIVEGMQMVAAMRKYGRIVQLGSQHRSTERLQSAIAWVQSGKLGRVVVAKAWENAKQGSIGKPTDSQPPKGVDYDMWLGPAPLRRFNANRFHGRWRWFHDYGTGDLGNDGVHRLDMAMALLSAACQAQGEQAVGLPTQVSAHGGKWYFDDAQEFPDTMQVNYEFGRGENTKLLTYEMRVWTPYPYLGEPEGAAVFGDQAYLIMGNEGWSAHDRSGQPIATGKGDSHEGPHLQNFIECIKSRQKPACDLETIGHPASVLCHIGNVAARVRRSLTFDPTTEAFIGDDQANSLRSRGEYRKPWQLPAV